jgi:hypothetical protein
MSQQVFVDASAWISIADNSEAHHKDSVKTYSDLLNSQITLVTTSLMVAESNSVRPGKRLLSLGSIPTASWATSADASGCSMARPRAKRVAPMSYLLKK